MFHSTVNIMLQYYLFKFGVITPMVKGIVEIEMEDEIMLKILISLL